MDIGKKQQIFLFLWRRYSVTFDRMNRNAISREFAEKNQGVPVFPNRYEQYKYIYHDILKDVPIDYLEFGVFRGDSIREWCFLSTSADSRFYGFDTFTGLPERWFRDFDKGAFSTGGEIPTLQDRRVNFIKGLFQDTLHDFLKNYHRKNIIVLHMDADLYSSTLFVLISMHQYLKKGDVLMFDDFLDPLGEFKAFSDYCQAFRIKPEIVSAVMYGKIFDKAAFIF